MLLKQEIVFLNSYNKNVKIMILVSYLILCQMRILQVLHQVHNYLKKYSKNVCYF